MSDEVVIRVLLSFLLAGSAIAMLTLLAERFGSRIGGLITNVPSNILITLIFITLTQGTPFMQAMIPAVPIGMLIDAVFLIVFILLLEVGIWVSMTGSLLTWLLLAWLANRVHLDHLWINTCLYLVGTIVAFLAVELGCRIPAIGRSDKRYTFGQIALRALFAGGIVGSVVLISHFVPPYLTGIVSTFPAVLFSSMVILALARGAAFARATGKIMILASTNIVVYTIAVYYLYPLAGIVAGTLISFVLAVLWIFILKQAMMYGKASVA